VARLAVLSYHTSPLAQPGTGDGGGMNVYVANSRALSLGSVTTSTSIPVATTAVLAMS